MPDFNIFSESFIGRNKSIIVLTDNFFNFSVSLFDDWSFGFWNFNFINAPSYTCVSSVLKTEVFYFIYDVWNLFNAVSFYQILNERCHLFSIDFGIHKRIVGRQYAIE